ncbi:MAG: Asp-tRNA(Asn)/Glu-tRNA(Gln) amidotransferase subunit GatA [Deltaproteobacteria bacterium]|jgi:aspartyl-tRNA(Asn)/glutamyl-tRNA(Gln) amidotransferase subunit A|nr:Asp-tRNA(Asn)/Glu-tRNA(Gln) amidotransferase subunit GatA [Deltaproteobacteria bacterium]MBT4526132.1 Asp-tRNA(Asn)/Glu-tRNA(Gln) amidotransferase subunit GatA [Deltaproteobacteria bacterium]
MSLYQSPIHHLHQRRMQGEITTQEIVESCIQRIEDTEDQINSFLTLTLDQALEQAKKIDQKILNKDDIHPLAGMPIAIKDVFSTKGIATTCGSKYLKDYVPPFESTVSEKLNTLGYSLLGKTNMDEFAMGSSTENSAFKVTKNPYNLDHVPGGSSGGSAAAVASGQALAAMGTDTGGSVRQPAAFTGIVGLKPTYGRVSRWGLVAYASSFDQAGPMTQDVTDTAILLEAVSGFDNRDATSLQVDVPNYSEYLNQPITGLKIGIIKDLDLSACDEEVKTIYFQNLDVLKSNGAEITEIEIPNIKDAIAAYYIIAPCEASSNLGRYDGVRYGLRSKEIDSLKALYEGSREAGFGKEVKLRILLGTFALSAGYYDAYYIKAQKLQNLLRSQFHKAFKTVDAIALPATPTAAFKIGEMTNDPLQMYLNDVFTISANLAGIPGISIPGGFTRDQLPVGFQLLAGHLNEGKIIQIAYNLESSLNLIKPSLAI